MNLIFIQTTGLDQRRVLFPHHIGSLTRSWRETGERVGSSTANAYESLLFKKHNASSPYARLRGAYLNYLGLCDPNRLHVAGFWTYV